MRRKQQLYGRATVVRSNPHRSYAGGERSDLRGEMQMGSRDATAFGHQSTQHGDVHLGPHTHQTDAHARGCQRHVSGMVCRWSCALTCAVCRCGRAHTSNAQCSAGGMRDTRACAPLREGNMDPCTHGDTTGITVSSQLQIVGRAFCIGIGTLVPGWFIRFDRW